MVVVKIEFEKLSEIPLISPDSPVKVTEMGNVVEVQYMTHRNTKQTIQILDGREQYVILATGEIKDCVHHDTRKGNVKSLYKTFSKARAIINANVTDVSFVRWITLTYADNMTDTKQLYRDFQQFNQRFQYYCKKNNYGKAEYIVMMEPQGRGAWHAHLLYIWEHKAPYIPNEHLAEIWGHGFVKIKKLDNVDNVGAYLTAYLGDMEIDNDKIELYQGSPNYKEVEVDEDGAKIKKSIIKGERLKLYPKDFNMFRYSRGCKKPTISMCTQEDAKKKVLGAAKTFESAVKLTDSHDQAIFENVIVKKQYNRAIGKKQ